MQWEKSAERKGKEKYDGNHGNLTPWWQEQGPEENNNKRLWHVLCKYDGISHFVVVKNLGVFIASIKTF